MSSWHETIDHAPEFATDIVSAEVVVGISLHNPGLDFLLS